MDGREIPFTELRLIPGQAMQLEFDGYTSDRDRAVLLGYKNNATIIMTMPIDSGAIAPVKNGQKINVRFFASRLNGVCAFKSEVLYTSKVPYPHMHIAYPPTVILGEVRRALRAEVDVIASAEYEQDGEAKKSPLRIKDLSVDGARMVCKNFSLASGSNMTLAFKVTVTDIECLIKIDAIVRSVNEQDGHYSLGVQFTDVNPNDRIALQAFVLASMHKI
ncbi:MAG: flagellar brake protein [Oceanospirillaceae bacterium]|nr:flagellar brake protein [Oceanospirillaceae bacterium]MCP5349955.1 flagellar brake protein [Oceanospirillaceae bacterium]